MTPEQALEEARSGALRPVYLVLGEERFLADQVTQALRLAALQGGIAGFNEDKFTAGEPKLKVDSVVSAARMTPMMAKRRVVLVRSLERWEKKGDAEAVEAPSADDARASSPLDALAEYAKAPVDTTVLVLGATKLHGQRKLVTHAKKVGYVVTCDPVSRRDLPSVVVRMAREKGHPIKTDVADLLAEVAGPELGYVADAVERLSLYVGEGQPLTEEAIAAVVTRVRQATVWELVGAVGRRRLDEALRALHDAYDSRDGGLKLLGALAWSVKQLVRFEAALGSGASVDEAARKAGVAPFKAREVAGVVRGVPRRTLERWMRLLAETDLALKSSRRPGEAILEALLIRMCSTSG